MNNHLSSEDQEFRKQFETCVTALSDFNHRAHVRMAYIYLCENEPNAACQKMRGSLQTFLTYYGVDPSKFHETMTRAWILAVRHFMVNALPATSADNFISSNPRLLDGKVVSTHYSEEVLFSEEARLGFVEPDLA